MQEAYIDICGVPSHVMTWGKWIEESLDDSKEIIICITGNPGLAGFYTKFLSTLHNKIQSECGANIPVWIIGHAGHDEPPSSSLKKCPPLNGNEKLYDLNAQIQHKLRFIETYVPKDVKIHLIGHSIGAWIILQLLKNPEIKQQVQKTYLLFPTIERMKSSMNGQLFTRLLVPCFFFVTFLVHIFNIFPVFVRVFMIYFYFWLFSIPNYFIGTALKYLKWSVIEKVVFLAKQEMDMVQELDQQLIEENKNLIKLYYGKSDGWVPVKYFTQIKEKIPDLDTTLDNKNIGHAFVLKSSEEMSSLLCDWIKENRFNKN